MYCPTKGFDYKVNLSINPNDKQKTAFLFDAFANYYHQFTKRFVLKVSSTNLFYQSKDLQKNELYSIGGANLLRGFEQNAFLCSAYSINTLEIRWLFAKYSFIGAFYDSSIFREYRTKTKYANSVGFAFQLIQNKQYLRCLLLLEV